jgi:hypothetical protein
MSTVRVTGVGMVPFATLRKSEPYDVMAGRAIRAALVDAGIALEQVQQAYAGYVYGDSTSGQKALYISVLPPRVQLRQRADRGLRRRLHDVSCDGP